ncbi:MAG: HD-GYP domain-containing protein [Oscillospiraceae bacterium]
MNNSLIKISSGYFRENMQIESKIYILINDNYVLLCDGGILEPKIYQKMKSLTANGEPLYVSPEYYDKVVHRKRQKVDFQTSYQVPKISLISEAKKAAVIEFADIKNNVDDVLSYAKENEKIEIHKTREIGDRLYKNLKTIDTSLIIQCINEIRTDDEKLFTHSTNVSLLNGIMAKWLNLNQADTNLLIDVGLLHDLGKLKVPDEIMNKPGRLTKEEFEIVMHHPVDSYEMLKNSGVTDYRLLYAVRGHHEKANGTGYPDKLTLSQIPLFAKITAISDIYDAMVSKRSYKKSLSPFVVLAEFGREKFANLDIHLVNTFLSKMPLELIGKKMLMSNGEIGTVIYVDTQNLEYPMVNINGQTVQTTPALKCIEIYE